MAGTWRGGIWLLSAAAHACSLLQRVKWLAGGKRVAEKARWWSCTLRSSCAGAVVGTRHRPGITVCPFVGGLKKSALTTELSWRLPPSRCLRLIKSTRDWSLYCVHKHFFLARACLLTRRELEGLEDSGHSGAAHPSEALVAWTHQPKGGGWRPGPCFQGTLVVVQCPVPLFLGATPLGQTGDHTPPRCVPITFAGVSRSWAWRGNPLTARGLSHICLLTLHLCHGLALSSHHIPTTSHLTCTRPLHRQQTKIPDQIEPFQPGTDDNNTHSP